MLATTRRRKARSDAPRWTAVRAHARGMRSRASAEGHRRRRAPRLSRRGVVSILAMMFLVMFGSLAGAMAAVTQGNLRSASSHLRMTRALGAVDTGFQIAEARLLEAAQRTITARGEITPEYAAELWYDADAADLFVRFDPPRYGRVEPSTPNSIMDILEMHHASDDANNVIDADAGNASAPVNLPASPPEGFVVTPPIGLERTDDGLIVTATQITYAPPVDGRILVIVTGYDWDHVRSRWVSRTAQAEYEITRRIAQTMLGPTRVMLGQGAASEGPMAITFDSDALDTIDGPPLASRSDFYGLDPALDEKLADFYNAILDYDANRDNRLSLNHAVESQPLAALNLIDYDGDDTPDAAFTDLTFDGTIDEFDIFARHFDADGDGEVVLSAALTAGTPNAGRSPEFVINDAIALLIDSGNADRNNNTRFNGRLTAGAWDFTTFVDNDGDGNLDADDIDHDDVTLGYRDGVLDFRDSYAKIRGSITFAATRQQWEQRTGANDEVVGNVQGDVQGVIRTPPRENPMNFSAGDAAAPTIEPESFTDASQALIGIANSNGQAFATQAGAPASTTYEATPYGAPSPADYYQRPVYIGVTFENVTIPWGTNALFIDCTFKGVTYIRTWQDNTHPSWRFYGMLDRDAETGAIEPLYPPPPAEAAAALDQSYAMPGDIGYDTLPPPLYADHDDDAATPDIQITDTKLLANNLRFHNCQIIGSVVADRATNFTNVRNKLVFTGASKFRQLTQAEASTIGLSTAEWQQTLRSSLMAPHWSVDIGSNMSPPEQDVRLDGVIIAGVLDMRGRAEVFGVLLMTFEPVHGQPPLELYGEAIGNPADFNVTLGHFAEDDGDLEGALDQVADYDGDGSLDLGWDIARDEDGMPIQVAGWDGVHLEWWYDGAPDLDAPDTIVRRIVPWHGTEGTPDSGPTPTTGPTRLVPNPNLILPDGLPMPINILPIENSYTEGRVLLGAN
ncbi:MAG: hypothetical protein ACTS3F_12850 [Phycisphaerales bacterium]